jgi:uncharacterized Fe-S cluster protein YjdI
MPKRVQTYASGGITVTFDPNLCMHSGVCLRALPAVFDVGRKRWIQPDLGLPEQVAAVVRQCPSGALQYSLSNESAPALAAGAAVVRLSQDGPLLLEGAFRIERESGEAVPHAGKAALCRCGATSKQPFCDGSHARVGFRSKA